MNELGLCEIALGGFEVFDELTRIPLRKLTFMFGPNSAGKSSVEKGILLLSEICDDEAWATSFDTDPTSRRARLIRAWRRTSNQTDSYAEQMQLCASTWIDGWGNLLEDLITPETIDYYNPPGPGLHRLEVAVRFRDKYPLLPSGKALNFIVRDITLLLDGVPFLEFSDGEEAGLNFAHPLLSSYPIPEACRRGESIDGSRVSTKDGWLRIRGGMHLDGPKRLDQGLFVMDWIWEWKEGLETPPIEIIDALRSFANVFDKILENGLRATGQTLKSYTVHGSRSTPKPQDLSFLIEDLTGTHEDEYAAFHITMHGDPRYRRLACSFATRIRQEYETTPVHDGYSSESYAQSVNQMLSEYLFIDLDKGYQLKADHRVLMTPEQFESPHDSDQCGNKEAGQNFSLLIALHLSDVNGRHLAFTEVGSGLGYVLPVLAAACDDTLPVVFVQQPELHLHPALQVKLGDVFVHLCSDNRRLLIETHSEHLLLRVLKRLRQSGTATCSSPDLYIEPDDVAILYFNPDQNGTTSVKRLRVSADGEFLDRWPRGFFTERDEELFDE